MQILGLLCMFGGVYLSEAGVGGWVLFAGYILWTVQDAQWQK